MSTRSETYRVLIASPSDMAEERHAASEAIYEWNAQHAETESAVLLPVKWESHTYPQAGVRPQEEINRQIVRDSDIVVGMFWTKLGTNTGVAESGAVEEINQFVATGKPALLYFSSRPIDPNKIIRSSTGNSGPSNLPLTGRPSLADSVHSRSCGRRYCAT